MSTTTTRTKNRRLAGWLFLLVAGMFGFGYALVPLYNVFCEITGLNGKSATLVVASQAATQVDSSRLVTVEFAVNVSGIPWLVTRPERARVQVHPGEAMTVAYRARSLADNITAGQAIPSVTPARAARYFRKTECFCFSTQELQAREERLMPLTFVVDPQLPDEVKTITLSYAVYPVPGRTPTNS
mgnify:FL=1